MKTAMQELMDKVQSINERYELKEDANWLPIHYDISSCWPPSGHLTA